MRLGTLSFLCHTQLSSSHKEGERERVESCLSSFLTQSAAERDFDRDA